MQQVFLKLLSGERKWPKHVDIYTVFNNIMKSIRSAEYNKNKKCEIVSLHSLNENSDELIGTIYDKKNDFERNIIRIEEIEAICNLFSDDKIAQDVLIGKLEGLNKEEIIELTGLTDKDYNSKMRKVRRRIFKSYPGGLKHE